MLIVKIGGGKNINWEYLCADIAVVLKTRKLIIVHGANTTRDELAEQLGVSTRYIDSPSGHKGVYTDKRAIEILTMAYAGLVNKRVVSLLQKTGVNAIGLSGADGRIWEGKRKTDILAIENGKTKLVKDTFTGKVEKVNAELINLLVDNNYVPVVTQPAISYEGDLINTDNDRNLAVMAGDLKATELVVLFEAPGLLHDSTDEKSLIPKVNKGELTEIMENVSGRMRKKVLGAKEAFAYGVKKIYWGDARIEHPITVALNGKGTIIS